MIESYRFGNMKISGTSYSSDLVVCGETVKANWWRKKGHELCIPDISAAIDQFNPNIIIIGTGKFSMMTILPETRGYLESLRIQLIAEKTGQAWQTYNRFSGSETVLGMFHLTC
jgi:hypothetical protein